MAQPDTNPIAVSSVPYADASIALRREFCALHDRVYPVDEPPPNSPERPLHGPEFDCLSFYIRLAGRVISYAAVASKTIDHAGHTFALGGLSSVMTDPAHQRRGLGSATVAAATRWMERSDLDVGVFTCDPPLAGFYAKAGAWPVVADVVLVGSRQHGALRSDVLEKVVLMRLLSGKAAAASAWQATTIDLAIPVGGFL